MFLVESLNNLARALSNEDYSKCARHSLRFSGVAHRNFAREEKILAAIKFPFLGKSYFRKV